MPNVLTLSCPNCSTFSVRLPVSTSMICCAPNPKPLAFSQRKMQDMSLLRGVRAVPLFRRREAVVAVTAGRARFAEVIQQTHAPAFDGFAQAQHGIELRARDTLVFFA